MKPVVERAAVSAPVSRRHSLARTRRAHAGLDALRDTAPDAGPPRAVAACVALRDAWLSPALAVRIARQAPELAAAITLACDVADEGA